MIDNQDSFVHHRHRSSDSTSFSSRAPSRASFVPSSRASSPVSWAASDTGSRPPSAMSDAFNDLDNNDLQDLNTAHLPPSLRSPSVEVSITTMERPVSPPLPNSGNIVLPEPVPIRKGKGKGKAKAKQDSRITITRELKVDEIVDLSILPSTFPVSHHPTALRIDLSKVEGHLTNATGKRSTLDAYIRSEVSYLPCQSTAVLTNPIRTRTPGKAHRGVSRVMLRCLASPPTRPRVSKVVVAICIATELKPVNTSMMQSSRAASGMNLTKMTCVNYGTVN
jgi:hypothetical protein